MDELFEFWVAIFGGQIDITPEDLRADEHAERMTLFLKRLSGKLAGACLLVASKG